MTHTHSHTIPLNVSFQRRSDTQTILDMTILSQLTDFLFPYKLKVIIFTNSLIIIIRHHHSGHINWLKSLTWLVSLCRPVSHTRAHASHSQLTLLHINSSSSHASSPDYDSCLDATVLATLTVCGIFFHSRLMALIVMCSSDSFNLVI